MEAKGTKDSVEQDENPAEPATDPEADELGNAPTVLMPSVSQDSDASELAETAEYFSSELAETVALPSPQPGDPSPATDSELTRETGTLPVATPRFRGAQLPPVVRPPVVRPSEARAVPLSAPSAAGAPVAVLVPIEGDLLGSLYPLYDGQNSLGRGESNSIMLSSMKVSRQQALIIHRRGVFTLHPLSESNAIAVDDAVATGCVDLRDGATIRVGLTIFRFRTIEPL